MTPATPVREEPADEPDWPPWQAGQVGCPRCAELTTMHQHAVSQDSYVSRMNARVLMRSHQRDAHTH